MLSNKRFARTALAGIGFCTVTGALFGTGPRERRPRRHCAPPPTWRLHLDNRHAS